MSHLSVCGSQDSSPTLSRAALTAQVIARRRSTRRFTSQPVDDATIQRLIQAGIDAPSGSNWQNQRFIVMTDPAQIEAFGKQRWVWPYRSAGKETNPSGILGKASALILVFADAAANDFRGRGEYHIWEPLEIQNAAASIQNICLLATAEGLGNCWVSASESMSNTRLLSNQAWSTVLRDYDIPPTCKIQGIVCLGHPERVDEDGFPLGEKKHGATVWASTQRQPVEHYMLPRHASVQTISVSKSVRFRLRVLSRLAKTCRRWLFRIDRSIEKLEKRTLQIQYTRDGQREVRSHAA